MHTLSQILSKHRIRSKQLATILCGFLCVVGVLVATFRFQAALFRNFSNLNSQMCWVLRPAIAERPCGPPPTLDETVQFDAVGIRSLLPPEDNTSQVRWYALNRDWEQLVDDYRESAVDLHDPLQTYFAGQALYETGNGEEAISVWKRFPSIARLLTFHCTTQINLRHWDAARELCQLAYAVDPTFALAHAELGRVYMYGFRHLRDALAQYELADRLGDLNEAGLIAWAHTLDMLGRSTEAAQLLDYRDIDGALANAIRGNAFRQQGHLADAIRLYERSLLENRHDPWVYHAVAIAYLETGDREQAITYWRQALDLDPHFEPALRAIESVDEQ